MGVWRLALSLVLAAGVFGLAGTATAQMGSSRSGLSSSASLANVQAMRELSLFGSCFARSYRKGALELIATEPGSPAEAQAFKRWTSGEQPCLPGGTKMNLSVIYMRGVVAEGLLRLGDGVPASHMLPAPSRGEVLNLAGAARCYTAAHRPQVEALLLTKAGSIDEHASVKALWPQFRSACIPEKFTFRLNASWIRFLLAEAMLRLAPGGAPMSGH